MEQKRVYWFPADHGATVEKVVALCSGCADGYPWGRFALHGCDVTDIMRLKAMSSDILFPPNDLVLAPVRLRGEVEAALEANITPRAIVWADFEVVSFFSQAAQSSFEAAFLKVTGEAAVSFVMGQPKAP